MLQSTSLCHADNISHRLGRPETLEEIARRIERAGRHEKVIPTGLGAEPPADVGASMALRISA